MMNLGKQAALFVAHPHLPASDHDLEVDLVKLAAADNVSGEGGM